MRNYLPALAAFLLPLCVSIAAEPLPKTPPPTVRADLNLSYGKTPEQELKLDLYTPTAGGDALPACVLVHGGGWVKGDKERFTPLAIGLAERGYVVANIEYRLGTAAKYPAAVQDCTRAVRFIRANAARFRVDPNRIGAWGGSAGGHLVGLLAAAPEAATFRAATDDLKVSSAVQATCIMAGPTDLANETFVEALRRQKEGSYAFQWLGKMYDDAPDLYREASPLTHFTKQIGPILFLCGDLDNPARDAAALEKLKSLSVPTKQIVLKGAKHGCWLQPTYFEQCVDAVDAWFKEHLKPAAAKASAN